MYKIVLLLAAILGVATAKFIVPYYSNYYYGNNYQRAGYYGNYANYANYASYGYPAIYTLHPYAYLYK